LYGPAHRKILGQQLIVEESGEHMLLSILILKSSSYKKRKCDKFIISKNGFYKLLAANDL